MSENRLDHTDIREQFTALVNIVEPDHPYYDSPYPISEDQVDYGHKKHSSSYYASCGPVKKYSRGTTVVSFSSDRKSFNTFSDNRLLAVYVHEMSHISVGRHSDTEHGSHPPQFWRSVGFHAHTLLDNWDKVKSTLPDADRTGFIGKIIDAEVNQFNIDKRYTSVRDQEQEMAKWFRKTLA